MSEIQEFQRKITKKPALGRGLGSLLGEKNTSDVIIPSDFKDDPAPLKNDTSDKKQNKDLPHVALSAQDQNRIWQLGIEKIKPNKNQPRKHFATEPLKELAQSIKEKGILQPIVVRRLSENSDSFEIIAGERRWRAAQLAGLHEVPAIVKISQDQEALELALIENIQRENLNPIEEAEAYQHLIKTYSLTQQSLADQLGKDRATVANTLRLLGLASEVRTLLSNQQITIGHAKVLLAVADQSQQRNLAQQVVLKKTSVRELERQVANFLAEKNNLRQPESSFSSGDLQKKHIQSLCEELQKTLGTRVSIDYDRGKGRVSVHFYSDEELHHFIDRVRGTWSK